MKVYAKFIALGLVNQSFKSFKSITEYYLNCGIARNRKNSLKLTSISFVIHVFLE